MLVTGANRGLGLAVCKALVARGIPIIVTGRDRATLQRAMLESALVPEIQIEADFSRSLSAVFRQLQGLPYMRAVVHCAAIYSAPLAALSERELCAWGWYYGNTLALAHTSLANLKKSGGGRMILIGSIVGALGRVSSSSPYSISKGWLRLLSEGISVEGCEHNVTSTYLNVGSFRETPISGQYLATADVVEEILRLVFLPSEIRVEQSDLLPAQELLRKPGAE